MSKRTRAVLLLVALMLVVAIARWLAGFVAQDRCLDSGGRWNGETRSCEGGN